MLNRILVLFLAMAALGSSAFASRATTTVMGTGDAGAVLNGGSLYYDDAYNIFYNPAYVNDFKNWAIIEKSNSTAGANASAQGGAFWGWNNWNWGVFFNRGDAIKNGSATAVPTVGAPAGNFYGANGVYAPSRPVEVYGGTDLGMAKIGLGLTYASNTASTANSSYLLASIGAQINGFDPFASGTIASKDSLTDSQHKFYRIGTKYHMGEWTPYLAFSYVGNPTNAATAAGATNTERNWVLGVGRSTKLTDAVRLMYSVSYVRSSDTGNNVDNKRNIVPIDVAAEADALSWLTLRAGLNYHLVDKFGGANNTTNAANTTGRLGATAHAGKADFEFAVGSTAGGAENPDGATFDVANGLFTAANMTYHF